MTARAPLPSYVHGATSVPLLGETIGQNLDRTAARHGDRPALVVYSQNVRLTYAELRDQADAFAAGLLALGLKRGDRVGLWSLNRAEWIVALFGVAKAGLVLVNVNPAYRTTELEYALNLVGCAALITATRFKTSDYLGMLREIAPELDQSEPGHLRSARLPALRTVIQIGAAQAGERAPGTIPFEAVPGLATPADRARLAEIGASLQFDDPVNIQFTYGNNFFLYG